MTLMANISISTGAEPTNARWRSPCLSYQARSDRRSQEDATIKTRRRKNVLDFRVAIFALLITGVGFADRVAVAAPSFSHVFIVMEENRSLFRSCWKLGNALPQHAHQQL